MILYWREAADCARMAFVNVRERSGEKNDEV